METVPWPPRLMLSWTAPESHYHSDLPSLGSRVGIPQAHSKVGNNVPKLEPVPPALRSLPDARVGLESLFVSSGLHTGPLVSAGCWVSPQ